MIAAEWGRFTTLAGLTAKTTLSSRKGAVTWVVALLPLYVVGGVVAAGQQVDIELFQILIVALLNIVLVVTALVHGARLFREELEDNTLAYLTTRGISKASLVAYKFLGYYASALVIVTLPIVATYFLAAASTGVPPAENLEVLGAFVTMAAVGIAAFGGLFLLIGFALKRALMAGLLYGFLWETLFPNLPGNVPLLSITHYLRSIGQNLVSTGVLSQWTTTLDLFTSVLVPLLVAAAAVFLTYVLLITREIKSKD
jgi:ABC-type transport system involved in multi-copper enzyme maturation permease subunit